MLDDFTQTIHQPIWPKRWHATGLNRSKIKQWLIAFVPSNVHTKYYQRNEDSFIHSMTKDRNSCATAENLVESYDHWCDHMHIELWCIIRNIVQGVYGVIAVNFGIYSFSSCIQIRFFSKCYSCTPCLKKVAHRTLRNIFAQGWPIAKISTATETEIISEHKYVIIVLIFNVPKCCHLAN